MIQEKKQYHITIFDQSYTLVSDESEKRLRETAQLIDSLMHTIADRSPSLDRDKTVMLTALRVASMLLEKEAMLADYHKRFEQLIASLNAV